MHNKLSNEMISFVFISLIEMKAFCLKLSPVVIWEDNLTVITQTRLGVNMVVAKLIKKMRTTLCEDSAGSLSFFNLTENFMFY